MVTALHAHVGAADHVVAQVVEAELGVGAVRDVGGVGGLLEAELHAVLQKADAHAHELVDLAHPLAVSLGEVVVDGDDVHALARDRVEVAGERRDERLALAGLHLGDHAAVQRDRADDLDVEVTHAHGSHRRLAHGGEGLGEKVVQALARGVAVPEDLGLATKLVVAHGLELGLEVVDLRRDLLELLELLVGTT